jgi:hypothetical protein
LIQTAVHGEKIKSTLRAIVLMVFDSNPFEPDTLFSTAKNRVSRKMPHATKVFNRTKRLILGSLQMFPPTSAQMTSLSFAPKINLFVLKL